MDQSLSMSIAGTVLIWATSSVIALVLATLLLAGSDATRPALRLFARAVVDTTRGMPTSLLVLGAGLGALRLGTRPLPALFPGTPAHFQLVAVAVVAAVGIGGAGHLTEIFRSARAAVGTSRLEQVHLLGMPPPRRWLLVVSEAAPTALAPTSARLVHQLHNTAFVAFFPIADVFGFVRSEASRSFDVMEVVLVGCLTYVVLSGLIWSASRSIEMALARRSVGGFILGVRS